MPRYNSLTIVGHLGQDAEVRTTNGGETVTGFSVAVSAWKKDQPSTWFRCSWWGERGAKVSQYLRKGDAVLVTGEVALREFQGKDGVSRASLEVRVQDVQLLGGKPQEESRREPARAPAKGGFAAKDAAFDDDMPDF